MPATLNIGSDEQFSAKIAPVDAAGNDARIDGTPVWTSSDPAVLTVTPEVDGMSAVIAAVGPKGTATVTVTADADLGEGVRNLTDAANVTVLGGEAEGLGLSADSPTKKKKVA